MTRPSGSQGLKSTVVTHGFLGTICEMFSFSKLLRRKKVVIFGLFRSSHLKIMAEQRRLPASMSVGSWPAFSNVAFSFQYTPGKYLVSLDIFFPMSNA